MVFKINIGTKSGKTYKLETEAISLMGKKLQDKIPAFPNCLTDSLLAVQ